MEDLDLREVYDEKLKFSRCYTKDEQLVILLSGDGWSFWANEPITTHLLMDSRVVKFFIENYKSGPRHDQPMKDFLQALFRIHEEEVNEILCGLEKLKLAFVTKGSKFRVLSEGFQEYVSIYREDLWRDA